MFLYSLSLMSGPKPRIRRSDVLVALGLAVFAPFVVFIVNDLNAEKAPDIPLWGQILFTVVLHVPLAWRRVAPMTVAATVGTLFAVYRLVEIPEGSFSSMGIFFAVFAAGAYSDSPRRHLVRAYVLAWSAVALFVNVFREVEFVGFDGLTVVFVSLAVNIAFFASAWLLGDAWRRRRLDAHELSIRADQLAAQRETDARRAVLDERVRIARELHDVVAHHVSVMGVQAAGARRILTSDPKQAGEALASVEESSRQAVVELQRLVGFLRSEEENAVMGPQPTVGDIEALISQVSSTGLPVSLRSIGVARELPLAVSLSAYRIVQESLTNVIKHAGNVETTVVVSYLDAALELEIVNESGGTPHEVSGTGRGQLGMHERTAMVGGSLDVGTSRAGGYRVKAVLPTEGAFDEDVSA